MLTESRILLTAVLLSTFTVLPGCGTLYLLQAARGQAQILVRRRPIAQVVADPATPPAVRAELKEVSAAREFASRELDLPDNRSYRLYADVGRPYVVWNVVAAPQFSVNAKVWCFPIVGCVAYRGYFHERAARRYAAKLSAAGYDVLVEGIPAYSTLGHFDDPVLNTMLPYGQDELAQIIFHELTHQLLYVPGDSSFDEAFAVTVQEEGLARWLRARGRPQQIARFARGEQRQLQYVELLRAARADLAALYAGKLPAAQMLARKQARLARLAADMRALQRRQGVPSGYEDWLAHRLNNAELASVATYQDCVPGFQRLLAREHDDLPRFYAAVRALAREPMPERDAQVCARPRPQPAPPPPG